MTYKTPDGLSGKCKPVNNCQAVAAGTSVISRAVQVLSDYTVQVPEKSKTIGRCFEPALVKYYTTDWGWKYFQAM